MINKQNSLHEYKFHTFVIPVVLTVLIATFFTGCAANFGNYRLSRDVAQMFETLNMSGNYKYYYIGSDKNPDALMGLDRNYTLNNDLWKETDMNQKQLKNWIDEFNLNGYANSVYGQYILDPKGKNIGIYYSKWEGGPVKMEPGNRVVIYPPDSNPQRSRFN